MATSIPSSKRILANLFELLSNQNECVEWWFGFQTKNKNLNIVQPTKAPNKYLFYELIGISSSDWNLFLYCKFLMKRDEKFLLSENNLEVYKSEFNLQFVSTIHSKRHFLAYM